MTKRKKFTVIWYTTKVFCLTIKTFKNSEFVEKQNKIKKIGVSVYEVKELKI